MPTMVGQAGSLQKQCMASWLGADMRTLALTTLALGCLGLVLACREGGRKQRGVSQYEYLVKKSHSKQGCGCADVC